MYKFAFVALVLFGIGPAVYAFVPAIAAIVGTTSYTSFSTMLLTVGAALASFAFSFYADGYTEESPTAKELNVVVQPYQSASGWSGAPSGTVLNDGLIGSTGNCRYQHRAYCMTKNGGCTASDNFVVDKGNIACNTPMPNDYTEDSGTGENRYLRSHVYTMTCSTTCSYGTAARIRQSGVDLYQSGLETKNAITPNNSLTIKQSETGFHFSPIDSDYLEHAAQPEFPRITEDGQLVLQYATPQGPAVTVVTRNNTSNTTDYLESIQTSTGQISQTSVSVGGSTGTVQTATQTQVQGDLAPVPQPVQGVIPAYSPVIAPVTPTDPETQPQIQFPSDYARQGEASAAAVQITTTLLQGDVVVPDAPDTDMPWFGDTFEPLSAFQINTAGATCPVWQFDALDENFYIDHHCVLIQDFNSLFFAMFTAFWVLLAIRTVMEA